MAKVKRSVDYKCPSCFAPLKFNPKEQNWVCEYCDSVFNLDDLKNNTKKYNDKDVVTEEVSDKGEYNVYRCPDCGAEIVTDLNTTSTFCVYCKNTSIIKERLVGKFEPKEIIPFSKTIEDARNSFKLVGKRHPLMPKSFNSPKNISEIRGIYIPFWLFSCTSSGGLFLKGTKSRTWRRGDYVYTKTDFYDVVREGNVTLVKVPNDGAIKFDDAIMNSIEPFDYSKLKDFDPSYLSGFLSEKYDVSSDDAKKNVIMRMRNTVVDSFMSTVKGYSNVVTKSDTINFPNVDVEYVLLPVYLLNIKYKNKFYTFAMNGESGKMIGNMPVDKGRAIRLFVLIFVISFIIMFLFFYLFIRSNV